MEMEIIAMRALMVSLPLILGGCPTEDLGTDTSGEGSCVGLVGMEVGEEAIYSFSEKGGPEVLTTVQVASEDADSYTLRVLEGSEESLFTVSKECPGVEPLSEAAALATQERVNAIVLGYSWGVQNSETNDDPFSDSVEINDFVLRGDCSTESLVIGDTTYRVNSCTYDVDTDTGSLAVTIAAFGDDVMPFSGLVRQTIQYDDGAPDSVVALQWWNGK